MKIYGTINDDNTFTPAPGVFYLNGKLITAPTEADYLAAGFVEKPSPAPVEPSAPDPTVVWISKAKVAARVDEMGLTAQFFAWIGSKAQYATEWYGGGSSLAYDPTANESDLLSLIAALGIETDQIPALIEAVKTEELA